MVARTIESGSRLRMRQCIFVILVLAGIGVFILNVPSVIGDNERNIEKYATRRVQPPYPQAASQYKIEGVVVVSVIVGDDGHVTQAEFIRGQNVFRSVSLDAAKRWQFKLPDSDPQGVIRFTFKLTR